MRRCTYNLLIRLDVIPSDCYEVVSVDGGVHVIEAQTMKELVDNPAVVETTLEGTSSHAWAVIKNSFQTYLLVQTHVTFARSVADVRRASRT